MCGIDCRTASAVPWYHCSDVGVCSAARIVTKPPRNRSNTYDARDVVVEARRVVLRDDEDPVEPRVDAVGDRHVDQPVLPGERDGGLGAVAREREEPRAGAAAEDDGEHRVIDSAGMGPLWWRWTDGSRLRSEGGAKSILARVLRPRRMPGNAEAAPTSEGAVAPGEPGETAVRRRSSPAGAAAPRCSTRRRSRPPATPR